jgi:hypothetical protein
MTINLKTMSTKLKDPTKEGDAASLKSASKLCGEEMEAKSWPNEAEMQATEENHSSLETTSFRKFGGLLGVCQSGICCNKFRLCAKTTVVVQFVPKLSCNPKSKTVPTVDNML